MELLPGFGDGFAIDEFVDDLLHGDMNGVLHTLHEPHREKSPGSEGLPSGASHPEAPKPA